MLNAFFASLSGNDGGRAEPTSATAPGPHAPLVGRPVIFEAGKTQREPVSSAELQSLLELEREPRGCDEGQLGQSCGWEVIHSTEHTRLEWWTHHAADDDLGLVLARCFVTLPGIPPAVAFRQFHDIKRWSAWDHRFSRIDTVPCELGERVVVRLRPLMGLVPELELKCWRSLAYLNSSRYGSSRSSSDSCCESSAADTGDPAAVWLMRSSDLETPLSSGRRGRYDGMLEGHVLRSLAPGRDDLGTHLFLYWQVPIKQKGTQLMARHLASSVLDSVFQNYFNACTTAVTEAANSLAIVPSLFVACRESGAQPAGASSCVRGGVQIRRQSDVNVACSATASSAASASPQVAAAAMDFLISTAQKAESVSSKRRKSYAESRVTSSSGSLSARETRSKSSDRSIRSTLSEKSEKRRMSATRHGDDEPCDSLSDVSTSQPVAFKRVPSGSGPSIGKSSSSRHGRRRQSHERHRDPTESISDKRDSITQRRASLLEAVQEEDESNHRVSHPAAATHGQPSPSEGAGDDHGSQDGASSRSHRRLTLPLPNRARRSSVSSASLHSSDLSSPRSVELGRCANSLSSAESASSADVAPASPSQVIERSRSEQKSAASIEFQNRLHQLGNDFHRRGRAASCISSASTRTSSPPQFISGSASDVGGENTAPRVARAAWMLSKLCIASEAGRDSAPSSADGNKTAGAFLFCSDSAQRVLRAEQQNWNRRRRRHRSLPSRD